MFKTGLILAGGSLLPAVENDQKENSNNIEAGTLSARRKLGSLEVSSIGIGVQNISDMVQLYQTN